ncbi:hypothetical protein B0T25DRAFT_356513 [Lasiosphaeria hispida]|uniref:Heterokaryon incompatibility domain-containing protein n=1 Tax=Lasiosphaeria hispida TaxID=260671 RepID=A0AAJ0M8M5_9PEZI|nr:hypothetical protein B0T25DRAFT_356513 [Lasiosphaeria hispida]
MRLINTASLDFEEYIRNEPPEYAILSHTHGDDDLRYRGWLQPQSCQEHLGQKRLCQNHQSIRAGERSSFKYIWIDNVCINKDSSADLSEAINSMSTWYHRAAVVSRPPKTSFLTPPTSSHLVFLAIQGGWFTRGWDLARYSSSTLNRPVLH